MRARSLFVSLILSVSAVGCASDAADDDLVAEVTEGLDDAKADQADLPFTPVEGLTLRASIGTTESGRVIRSAASFKAAFGVAAPADIDFADEWLAVYSAGTRPTGGYAAKVTRVRLSDSGLTVKVSAELSTPGEGCVVTQALTKPVAIARFPAQPGAARSWFGKKAEAVACTAPGLCGADITGALTTEVAGMLFTSESDYPLEVISFGQVGSPTIDNLRALTGTAAGTLIEQRNFNDLFYRLTEVYDESDPYVVENAERYLGLRAVMEDNLSELTVIRIGEIQIGVYFLGVTDCGELIAVKTTSIET